MAVLTGQVGATASQIGGIVLGGPVSTVANPPTLATLAKGYVAHLYSNQMTFKSTLGALASSNPQPVKLKQSINGGYQPITVSTPSNLLTGAIYGQSVFGNVVYGAPMSPGDIVTLTEQGGDGSVLFTGIVEETPDTLDPVATTHSLVLMPLVSELGDAYLNKNYTTPTDVAQMVRDAVRQTNHCSYTNQSLPDTGITAVYNFSYATCLDVLNVARLIAGINYFWHVDALGVVWFQPTGANPTFTVKSSVDYSRRSNVQSISKLRNFVQVVGGIGPTASAATTATYSNPVSQTNYGLRMLPPLSFPTLTDQGTVNAIAATLGAVFDRIHNTVVLTLPTYGQRILIGQPGGAILRYFEPSQNSLVQTEVGPGQYSVNYVVLDVETDGATQTVTIGDLPFNGAQDLQYELQRMVARLTQVPLQYPSAPLNTL